MHGKSSKSLIIIWGNSGSSTTPVLSKSMVTHTLLFTAGLLIHSLSTTWLSPWAVIIHLTTRVQRNTVWWRVTVACTKSGRKSAQMLLLSSARQTFSSIGLSVPSYIVEVLSTPEITLERGRRRVWNWEDRTTWSWVLKDSKGEDRLILRWEFYQLPRFLRRLLEQNVQKPERRLVKQPVQRQAELRQVGGLVQRQAEQPLVDRPVRLPAERLLHVGQMPRLPLKYMLHWILLPWKRRAIHCMSPKYNSAHPDWTELYLV